MLARDVDLDLARDLHHARILLDGLDVGIHRGASRRTASA
jgi:hypothetical protein